MHFRKQPIVHDTEWIFGCADTGQQPFQHKYIEPTQRNKVWLYVATKKKRKN